MAEDTTRVRFSVAELTDAGRREKENEDAVLCLPASGLFCVADGMGGGSYGGEASQIIVKALAARMADPNPGATLEGTVQLVCRILNEASYRIKDMAEERAVSSIGSTVVILLLDLATPGRAMILHAGDSRVYRLRAGTLKQLTIDHSIASALGLPQEGNLPPMLRGVITNAVGIKPTVDLDKDPVTFLPGDLFILCSDGLTRGVPDSALADVILNEPGASLDAQARKLVDKANAAGGEDNISVVLIRIDACPPGPADAEEEDGESPTDMTSRAALSHPSGEPRTRTTDSVVGTKKPG